MADDRVWLVCTTCEDKILLAKHWTGFPLDTLWYPNAGKLNPWLVKHLGHHPVTESGASTLGGNPGLKVVTDYCGKD